MQLETLYKRTRTGAIQYWKVETLGDTIFKESGQLGTSSPIIHKEVCEGKNIGRANETTPEQQADSQAQSDWRKKHDKGYKTKANLGINAIEMTIYENKQQPLYHIPGIPANEGYPLAIALDKTLPQFNMDLM